MLRIFHHNYFHCRSWCFMQITQLEFECFVIESQRHDQTYRLWYTRPNISNFMHEVIIDLWTITGILPYSQHVNVSSSCLLRDIPSQSLGKWTDASSLNRAQKAWRKVLRIAVRCAHWSTCYHWTSHPKNPREEGLFTGWSDG